MEPRPLWAEELKNNVPQSIMLLPFAQLSFRSTLLPHSPVAASPLPWLPSLCPPPLIAAGTSSAAPAMQTQSPSCHKIAHYFSLTPKTVQCFWREAERRPQIWGHNRQWRVCLAPLVILLWPAHLEGVPGNASKGNADSSKLLGGHLVTEEGNAAGQHNDELQVANHVEGEAWRRPNHQKRRPRHQQPQNLHPTNMS